MSHADSSLAPVPVPFSPDPRHLLDWALRLTAWINFVASIHYPLEEVLGLGAPDMANKLFSEQDEIIAMAVDTFTEILSAPEAGKKKIVTWLSVASPEGTLSQISLIKKVDTAETTIISGEVKNNTAFSGFGSAQIVLDGADQSLGLSSTVADKDWSYYLTWLDVE